MDDSPLSYLERFWNSLCDKLPGGAQQALLVGLMAMIIWRSGKRTDTVEKQKEWSDSRRDSAINIAMQSKVNEIQAWKEVGDLKKRNQVLLDRLSYYVKDSSLLFIQ